MSPREPAGPWLGRCLRRAQPLLGTLVTVQIEPGFASNAWPGNPSADGSSWLHRSRARSAASVQTDDPLAADSSALYPSTAAGFVAASAPALAAAFAAVAHVGRVMSAHCPTSDLGRLARVEPGNAVPIALDPHTVRVLRAAQHWQRLSAGAFDPARAARTLAAAGLRPAFACSSDAFGPASERLARLRFVGIDQVLTDGPLALDLGGIAKGYAVDLAVETLQRHGVRSGLVNAGGDLRAFGPRAWPIAVVRRGGSKNNSSSGSGSNRIERGLRTLCNAALATSQSGWHGSQLIATARLSGRSPGRREAARSHGSAGLRNHGARSGRGGLEPAPRCCTVQASSCIDADALTKWALQARSAAAVVRLARVLRTHRAALWPSA